MQCPDDIYEMLKDARYEYNMTLREIKSLEKEMDEISREPPTGETEMRIIARQMRLRDLANRKKFLNEFIEKCETQYYIKE